MSNLKRELDAKAKQVNIAEELLSEDQANDPEAVRRLFRGDRSRKKWERSEKKRG